MHSALGAARDQVRAWLVIRRPTRAEFGCDYSRAIVADDITRSRAELRELINGFRVTQTLYVLVTSGVADLLAGGPRTAEDLAASIGAHARALYRLLRALAGLGVLIEDEGHRFKLTPLGDGLLAVRGV